MLQKHFLGGAILSFILLPALAQESVCNPCVDPPPEPGAPGLRSTHLPAPKIEVITILDESSARPTEREADSERAYEDSDEDTDAAAETPSEPIDE